MRSVKSIVAGSLFIIIAVLLMQLAYIFVAVAYNELAKDFPLLNDISGFFRYLIGIPLFMVIMFFGGYISAGFAREKILPHCIVVGLITASCMIVPTLENANLTLTGVFVFVLAIGATSVGGVYWQKANKTVAA